MHILCSIFSEKKTIIKSKIIQSKYVYLVLPLNLDMYKLSETNRLKAFVELRTIIIFSSKEITVVCVQIKIQIDQIFARM